MKGLSSYDHSSRLWARWLSAASRFFLSWDKTSMHRTIFFCWQLYISTKFDGISQNFVQLSGDFNSPWSSSLLPNKLLPRPTFSAELTCQPSQLESIESIFAPCQTVLCGLRDKRVMKYVTQSKFLNHLIPCGIIQNVLSTEAIDSGSLREKTSLSTENTVPWVKQDVASQISYRQFTIFRFDNRI